MAEPQADTQTPPIRWGVVGTGKIAGRMADALRLLPSAEVYAVASRSQDRADAFAAAYGARRAYASYDALLEDAAVDVVYVATPHARHHDDTLRAFEAGRPVLCEKPLALNAREAAAMVRAARERGLFLMEGLWTRFIPLVVEVRRLLAEGTLGDVRLLTADFGFRMPFDASHRLYDPALGGGALLDVGIYPLALASMVWGEPERHASLAALTPNGVDEQAAVVLGYPDGRLATFYTSVSVDTPVEADFLGTEGRLRLHRRFHHPTAYTITRAGREETVRMPFEGNGLQFEAAEVMRCLRAGETECAAMPLDESVGLARTMDALRAEWGVRYPGEG